MRVVYVKWVTLVFLTSEGAWLRSPLAPNPFLRHDLPEHEVHGSLTRPLFESLQQADAVANVVAALLNTTFAHYVLDFHGRELP